MLHDFIFAFIVFLMYLLSHLLKTIRIWLKCLLIKANLPFEYECIHMNLKTKKIVLYSQMNLKINNNNN